LVTKAKEVVKKADKIIETKAKLEANNTKKVEAQK
jgi:hypothetical protein